MMKNYEKEKAANAKVIQALIADAEKYRNEAEFIIQRNRELESKQIVKDNQPENNIKLNDKRRQQEDEQTNESYTRDNDINRFMPDAERGADICARLERLAKENPAFAEFRGNSMSDGQ